MAGPRGRATLREVTMEIGLRLLSCEGCGRYTTAALCLDCRMVLEGRSYTCLRCGDMISPGTTDEHETADTINAWLRNKKEATG